MSATTASLAAGTQPEALRSSLYCVKCNLILHDAVEVSCCHALYCSGCITVAADNEAPTRCFNCCREVLAPPQPNLPVRRLVGTIPIPCTNEGCSEIVAVGSLHEHLAKQCLFGTTACRNYSRGCVTSIARGDVADHEKNYCIFRDVACPQKCGAVLQARECAEHFKDCARSLVDCPVRCGVLVERRSLQEHMTECPQRPVACPYSGIGCPLRAAVRRPEMEEHMSCSVHAHLQLLDRRFRELESRAQAAAAVLRRPLSHDWDPTYVQCVDKWPAQLNTITAMAFVDGFLVTGCEAGTLAVLDTVTGDAVRTVKAADEPIRSLLGLGDGRLLVGTRFCSLQVWANTAADLVLTSRQHPKEPTKSLGILSLAKANLEKQTHLQGKVNFLHPELYSVPTNDDDMLLGSFEVIFAALENCVRVLDAGTLEQFHVVEGHFGTVTAVVSHEDRLLVTGSADGSVRVLDVTVAQFPQLFWLQCFGGPRGVSSLCFAPNRNVSTIAIGGGDGTVGFWDYEHRMSCHVSIPQAHSGAVVSMCAVDGTHVASGGTDEYWRLFDGAKETALTSLPGSMYCSASVGGLLFAAGTQGCVRLWSSVVLRYNQQRQPPRRKEAPLVAE